MEIRRLEYKNVYGSLSGNLEFSRGENFLVGINGCGKTTVLNLIRWILGPSLPDLCTLQHDLIEIEVKHGRYLYSIQSRIFESAHELKVLTKNKLYDFKPINTALRIHPSRILSNVEEVQTHYEHLSAEPHEVATWKFLWEELPSPVFIGLERSIEERSSGHRIRRARRTLRATAGTGPLRDATTLMRDAFNTGRQRLVEINDQLNRQVLILSFSSVINIEKLGKSPITIETAQEKITQLQDRFEDMKNRNIYSKALSANDVRNAVVKYVKKLTSLLQGSKEKTPVQFALNQHNFERANKMLRLFEVHESLAQEVQLEITNFSRAINRFLIDSGKSIHFDEDTGIPYFNSAQSLEKLKLTELSSGEAQVVVLLSYFAFWAKQGIPIVIDEPELSLHVQWQKYFVNAVKEVMPDDCQTIMATHSPEICGAEDVNVQSISVRM